MAIFMPEVKCIFFQDLHKTLTNMHIGLKSYLWYVFMVRNSFEWKYVLGVLAVEILLNVVIFEILTYNYGKTVWSKENLKALSCFGDQCSSGYVKSFKMCWKKCNTKNKNVIIIFNLVVKLMSLNIYTE